LNTNPNKKPIKVPFMDLYAGIRDSYPELIEKIGYLIKKTQFIGGEEIGCFEKEFADFCRAKRAVACSSGTDALILTLKALGIGHGDVVITVPHTFIATAEAISAVGARAAFVDIEQKYFTMDPEKLQQYIKEHPKEKIKAVIPVHLYGQMADMESICAIAGKAGIKVVEDAAQAHGAEIKGKRPGAFGDAAAYSFYPGKNLGAFGDAGAVVTNNESLAVKIKMLSDHGRIRKYEHEIEGFNCRMDSIQAAILRVKLKRLEKANALRIAKADIYNSMLKDRKDITCPQARENYKHVYHLYVVRVKERDKTIEKFKKAGVSFGIHYPIPLHLQPAYKYLGYGQGDFPISEKLSKEILSLPLWPEIEETTIEYICKNI